MKQSWLDDNPETPLSADRLLHIEDGVEGAHQALATKADLIAGKVPDGQIPDRLSETNLNAAIDAVVTPAIAGKADTATTYTKTQTDAAIAGQNASVVSPATDATPLRVAVRAQRITAAAPLVAIGDSHTDSSTSAGQMWTRLGTVRNQPGEGLEGVPSAGIVAKGKNGQSLQAYLAAPAQTGGWNEVVALTPSWILACWLTNDVRLGGLGLTVAAIRTAGAARLLQLIDQARTALPNSRIVLRIPVPYTQQNSGTDNYITDGTTVNPAGLAQIYTDGVRLAHYDAVAARPGVLLYDPQTRFFGTTSPSVNGGSSTGYYANQIHQNNNGYIAEADDFASWVAAATPYNSAAAIDARRAQNPTAPWAAYHRVPEDTERYVKIADANLVRAVAGETFFDLGPSFPGAIPGSINGGDIAVLYGAQTAFQMDSGANGANLAADTRVLSALAAGLPRSAVAGTRAAIYRRITTTDDVLNVLLRDASIKYKRAGYIGTASTTYIDLRSRSYTTAPVVDASTWATELQAGDLVYIESLNATRITPVGITSGQTSITGTFTSADVGRAITGSGIQSGTYIVSQTGTAAVMSKTATGTNAALSATIGAIILTIGTDTSSNNASGVSLRLQGGLRGLDWSAYAGKAVVVTGNHA